MENTQEQTIPGLVIDPTELRGYRLFVFSQPLERKINNRRMAAAKRRLRLERERCPLFSDQVAELQETPEQRIRAMDERVAARFAYFDERNRERLIENLREIASMSHEDQNRFMAYWNGGAQPDSPSYMAVAIKKFRDGKHKLDAIVDRSFIDDPDLRKRVEKLDRSIATVSDILARATSEEGKRYAQERIDSLRSELNRLLDISP